MVLCSLQTIELSLHIIPYLDKPPASVSSSHASSFQELAKNLHQVEDGSLGVYAGIWLLAEAVIS